MKKTENFVTQKTFKTAAFSVYLTKEYTFFQVPAGLSEKEVWQLSNDIAGSTCFHVNFLSYRNLIQEKVVKLIGHKDQEEFFLFIG